TVTFNLVNNGQFQFSSATYTTSEGVGTFSATVTRTNGSTGAVTVPFTVTAGTATSLADYSTITVSPLAFADGVTSQTIKFSIVDDGSAEANENFSVALGTPSLGTLGSTSSTTVTITDPLLVVTSLTQTESGVYINFNRSFDPSTLNLYDSGAGTLGAADVMLTGTSTGAVRGNLIVPPAAQEPNGQANEQLYFVKTGGVLAVDTYNLVIRSAADGLKDRAGVLFDGDNNGS